MTFGGIMVRGKRKGSDLRWIAVFAFAGALPVSVSAAPETFVVDGNHSAPGFAISHGGIAFVRGLFRKTSGKITLDREAKSGSMEIMVDTASVVTSNDGRDKLIRDWFKVGQFPEMAFRSQNLKFSGDELVGADGELTLVGVTKPVSLTISSFKCIVNPVSKRETCGADGTAQIRRSDFGFTVSSKTVGDEVKIVFDVEARKE